MSIDDLSLGSCNIIVEYRSRYYQFKASITEQNITTDDTLKIQMLKNLSQALKTYMIILKDKIRKNEKQDDDEKFFKAIKKEKIRMIIKQKASVYFVTTKSHYFLLQNRDTEERIEWVLYKKYACKHSLDQVCRPSEDEYYRCHRRGNITRFHDMYIILDKKRRPEDHDRPTSVQKMPNVDQMYTEITFYAPLSQFSVGAGQNPMREDNLDPGEYCEFL